MTHRFAVPALAFLTAAAALTAQAPRDLAGDAVRFSPPASTAAFLANRGQWHPNVLHAARFGSMHVFLERSAITVDVQRLAIATEARVDAGESQLRHKDGAVVRFSFASPSAVTPATPLPGTHTFLLGNDPNRFRSEVPQHASVRYEAIADGISLDAYGKDGHFEYDLLVDGGADLQRLRIDVAGAERLTVQADGTLRIDTAVGPIVQTAPVAFTADGTAVRCVAELRGACAFGFRVPDWDGRQALRIDPGLLWSSYLGGSTADGLSAVAVGSDGRLTLAGGASSLDFPATPGAYQGLPVNSDCLVVRIDPSLPAGTQIVSSTWYGGDGTDNFAAIELDEQGVATLFGTTRSTNLPVTANAFQSTFAAGTADALVARIDLAQTGANQLVYASYLGGSGNEIVQGPCKSLVVDGGVITMTGSTLSTNFPTTANALSPTKAGGSGTDGFLARLDPSLPPAQQLVYSTYFGGTSGDGGVAVRLAPNGLLAIGGTTSSLDFPVSTNAYDTSLGGPGDGVLMLLDVSQQPAQQLVYSTYFGGSLGDGAGVMEVDPSGAFCFGSNCFSPDLPVTANAFDPVFSSQDAYLARLDPSLPPANQLTYCTYLGGSAAESATAIVVDAAGVITMSGGSTSTDFPTTAGTFQSTNAGGAQDMWVVRIDPNRPPSQQLLYGTYLGGNGLESMFALALDARGGVWSVGFTQSTNFPTTPNGYDGSANGANDAFLAHFDLLPTGVFAFGNASPGCAGPLAASVTSMPNLGNGTFAITCTNVDAPALGAIAVSLQPAVFPLSVFGIELWLDPTSLVTVPLATTSRGAEFLLPIANDPSLVGVSLSSQFAWFGSGAGPGCPATGWSASHALQFVVQP